MSNMSKGKTMKVYGITGSIACGKSTVTHYLIERGYLVVDADLISRNALTIDQECILKVQELFGCVKDGIVDRKALGRIVFHDKNAKKQLEAIIHPYTIINNQISSLKKREMADIVFDNNQGIEELYKQIDEFIERINHEEIINE